jgi:hypothetical protein
MHAMKWKSNLLTKLSFLTMLQGIVKKSCWGSHPTLATPSHKEGIKSFFTPPEVQTFFDSFFVARSTSYIEHQNIEDFQKCL